MLINPVGHLLQGFDDIIERSLPYAEGGKICEDFVHLTQLWLSRMQVAFSFAIPLHIVHMSSLGNFKVYILLKASSNSRILDECTE